MIKITLIYDPPPGGDAPIIEYDEKLALDVLREIYNYANKGLRSVAVEIKR